MFKWFYERKKLREEKKKREDLLLIILHTFKKLGREEISLGEIHDSILKLKDIIPQQYTFADRVMYSSELMEDMREFDYNNLIKWHQYKYDSLLPKKFVSLTLMGEGYSRKLETNIRDDIKEYITGAVSKSIENYQKVWRLWKR